MHADRRIGTALRDAGVDALHEAREQDVGIVALRADLRAHLLVDEVRRDRIVDLDVAAAGRFERGDLPLVDAGDVGIERFEVGIDAASMTPRPPCTLSRDGDGSVTFAAPCATAGKVPVLTGQQRLRTTDLPTVVTFFGT